MLIDDLRLVLKVAELKSITAAAHQLDIRVATASAAIKRVEKNLGMNLFIRTTRQLRLSPAGERYLPQCKQALDLLSQAETDAKIDQTEITGTLNIAVSSDLGRNLIAPWLDEFIDLHPQICIKLNISDSNIDFYRDSVYIALRYGFPDDANLYGFELADMPWIVCASPHYLAHHDIPMKPKALSKHNGLFYQLHGLVHNVWRFDDAGKTIKVTMRSNRCANDGDLVRQWCVAGKGIAKKPALDFANDIINGRLTQILRGYGAKSTGLWLITPSRQLLTPAIRALREFLQIKCQRLLAELEAYQRETNTF